MRRFKFFCKMSSALTLAAGFLSQMSPAQSNDANPAMRMTQPTKSHRRPVSLAPIMPQTIYAPLVTLGDSSETEFIINNIAARTIDVHYTIYALNGEEVTHGNLSLAPKGLRYLYLSELLQDTSRREIHDLGGIVFEYMGRPMGLLAQILYVGNENRNSIDGPVFHPMDLPSNAQNATWSTPDNAQSTIALGNLSTETVTGHLVIDSREMRDFTVTPHATRLLRFKDDTLKTSHFALISYQGPSGALRETGFVLGAHGYAAPIRFYDRAASPQADLFATDVPVRKAVVTMTLLNTGTIKITAHPQLFPIDGDKQSPQVDLQPIILMPGQSAAIALPGTDQQIQGSKANLFSVRVQSTGGPGDLIGSLVSIRQDADGNDIVAEMPLRVPGAPGQSTGSYPVRMDGDYTTDVTITNVGIEQKKYYAYLQLPSGVYTFPSASLAPGETMHFDINRIRNLQGRDVFGHTLPRNLGTAKFVWSIASPWGNARMIGRAYIRSAKNHISASYSCGVCCPSIIQGPFANPEPDGIFNIGDSEFGSVWQEQNDCEGNIVTFPSSLGTFDNPNVCRYSEADDGTFQLFAVGLGSTSLSYAFTWANLLADSQDCFIDGPFEDTNTDTVTVNPTIKPSRGMIGKSIDVAITGSNFDPSATITPSGNGINISNMVVQAGMITATLTIATNADLGSQTLVISQSGGSVNFFVQKPVALQPITRQGFPNGAQPVQTPSDGPILDANGNVQAVHQCGIYQNFIYGLFDQDNPPQQIIQSYTASEIFDNYQGPTSAPDPFARTTGPNGILTDIQNISKPAGVCLAATDKETFQQHFTIHTGDADNDLAIPVQPCVIIKRGNFTGSNNVSPGSYTLQRTIPCK